MEDQDDAKLAVPSVLSKALQSLGGNAKQQAMDDFRVVACHGHQGVG